MNTGTYKRPGERGAALVVGLILLLIITLLAVSGMSTASSELLMAGNEQFRQQAFQASSTGIERTLPTLANMPQTLDPISTDGTAPGSSTDTYKITSQYLGDDLNLPGFSAGKFVGFHYSIISDGKSTRGAQTRQTQGAFVIQSSGGDPPQPEIDEEE